MTTVLLSLVVAQAALLFWSALHLSNVFMHPNKGAQLLRCVATLALPLAIAWSAPKFDPHRILCGLGDGFGLVVGVACIRFWAVTKEEEKLAQEREFDARQAALAAAAARKAEEEERVRSAAAALEAQQTAAASRDSAAPLPPRHLAPSLLRSSARSPRFPSGTRK